jgi:hypothetical protein
VEHETSETVDLAYDDGEGMTETVRAVCVGSGLYRLLETPVFTEDFTVHDVVSVVPDGTGNNKIVEIVEHSGWSKESWFTTTNVIESPRLRSFLDEVAQAGGHYQVDSFFPRIEVSFPPGVSFEVWPAFHRAFSE